MIGRGVDSQGCGARRGAGTRARRSALLALVLLGALAPGPLAAQDAEDEEAQARELFIEGAHASRVMSGSLAFGLQGASL